MIPVELITKVIFVNGDTRCCCGYLKTYLTHNFAAVSNSNSLFTRADM